MRDMYFWFSMAGWCAAVVAIPMAVLSYRRKVQK
jgi:hypothetical protein